MKRKIDVEGQLQDGGDEGLMYDSTRALDEGLFDEITVRRVDPAQNYPEVEISKDLFDALMDQFDFGVNVGPNEVCTVHLAVTYRYGYGDADPV